MSAGHGPDDRHLDPPRVEEVADRVFAYIQPDGTWWINNTGFVVADDGVVAIDTCATERRTRAFLGAVSSVSSAPLRVVVNTHHHGDHTHGNHLTHPATIIGHTRCRDLVQASGIATFEGIFETPDWRDLRVAPPMVTFDDHLVVWAGDLEIQLHHLGTAAHTTNDVVAWLPEPRVLFAGDLVFNGGTPFTVMGSVAGSIAAVEGLRRFDAEVVVPGHGPVCDPSVYDGLVAYLEMVQRAAADAERAGIGALEAARALDLGELAALSDPERIVGNLHRALHELRGAAPGDAMDVPAAIRDMIAFNGGRPLRCLA